jgi:hypothetical protein
MQRFLVMLITGLLVWSGCRPPALPPARPALGKTEAERIVERLIEMGWLKYVPAAERERVRLQLVVAATKGYLDSDHDANGVSADRRCYPADNQQLAKGGIGTCVLRMKPILEQEGVSLDEVEDNWHEAKYQVLINREPYLVYDGKTSDVVRTSLERLLEIVNERLEEAGSDERLFALYKGRQGRVILLTEEMQDYVESLGEVLDSEWIPYSGEEVESAEEP